MKHHLQLFVLVFFSLAATSLSAFAQEEPPAVAAYLDAMKRQAEGYSRPSYGSIEPDGQGGAVLNDVNWSMKQPDAEITVKFGRMVISGVSQRPSGAYSFKSVLTENIIMSMDLPDTGPITIKIPSAPATNVHILPESSGDGIDYSDLLGAMVYEASTIPVISILVAGQSFDIKNTTIKWSGDPDTGLGKWDFLLESAVVPVSAIPNPKFQKDMKEEFGIEQFDLGIEGSASIIGQNDKFDIAYAIRLTGKQIGNFEFAIAAQEIPGKLAAELKQLQAGKQPNMGQIMPLVIGVKLAKLKIRFVDNNFARKMMAFAAKEQGTTVETMTSNGAALIQVGLMQLNLPEFSKTVIEAYNAFVKNPKNISIEASPEAPVTLATLMGLLAAPAKAIETLGVKVEANK
ncbi:hypothetical protein MNBD_ALPHA08-2106 [hydrothermal vent metagenome]|uniref:Uncharacterized protein n=1 Tax=hydrothermal vent metagenome TaxID=652676 RepID=A0A3B0QYK0_9ZZZZ